jgi:hypothetical protein
MKTIRVFLAAAAALAQTPTAPSLLSRGLLPSFERAPESLARPYLGVISGYDSGPLTSAFSRGPGPFQELNGGLEARRAGRQGSVRLDYQFAARHYSTNSRLDHSTHGLHLDARLHLARRWTFQFRDLASSSSFGDPLPLAPLPVTAGFVPDAGPEALHARTLTNTALADLIFAASPRTSVSMGGDGFLVQRQHRGLADVMGWRARADLAHRYRRHRTITLSYSFTRFGHTRQFGGADYAVYALGHSARLGKHSEFDLLAGLGRLRSSGLRAVELDPEIARLLGTNRGAEIFRLRTLSPHWLLGWSQRFGRAVLRWELARLVSDGGGLSGLARQNQTSLSLAVRVSRSWRLAAGVAGRTYRSLDTLLYDSTTAAAGLTVARRLGPRTELAMRYHYSFYHFDRGLLRWFHRNQIGAGLVYQFRDPPEPGLP